MITITNDRAGDTYYVLRQFFDSRGNKLSDVIMQQVEPGKTIVLDTSGFQSDTVCKPNTHI
jgi:hypothetical protein